MLLRRRRPWKPLAGATHSPGFAENLTSLSHLESRSPIRGQDYLRRFSAGARSTVSGSSRCRILLRCEVLCFVRLAALCGLLTRLRQNNAADRCRIPEPVSVSLTTLRVHHPSDLLEVLTLLAGLALRCLRVLLRRSLRCSIAFDVFLKRLTNNP
jgi:hypothetical protein